MNGPNNGNVAVVLSAPGFHPANGGGLKTCNNGTGIISVDYDVRWAVLVCASTRASDRLRYDEARTVSRPTDRNPVQSHQSEPTWLSSLYFSVFAYSRSSSFRRFCSLHGLVVFLD